MYNTIPSQETVDRTVAALTAHGFLPEVVATGADALARIKELIPAGFSVMNGSSTTLNQIGFVDYLKGGTHGWNNLHAAILAETDEKRKAQLRKESVLSDVYLGSAHAVTEDGKLFWASASGSQLPHLVFTSSTLILVVGTQKIVTDLAAAEKRLLEYVFPLEDKRMKDVGMGGSTISKTLVLHHEPQWSGRNIHILLVNEVLGF